MRHHEPPAFRALLLRGLAGTLLFLILLLVLVCAVATGAPAPKPKKPDLAGDWIFRQSLGPRNYGKDYDDYKLTLSRDGTSVHTDEFRDTVCVGKWSLGRVGGKWRLTIVHYPVDGFLVDKTIRITLTLTFTHGLTGAAEERSRGDSYKWPFPATLLRAKP